MKKFTKYDLENKDILDKEFITNVLKIVYLFGSICFLDIWLRVLTRWLNLYNIYSLQPNLFTVCWGMLFLVLFSFVGKVGGRILYLSVYLLVSIYVIIQYGYYLIFDKFLFLQDFLYASEGGNTYPMLKAC